MSKNNKILYVTHCSPHEYVYRDTEQYLERFPDVELRSASQYADEGLLPFPKSVKDVTFEMMMKFGHLYDAPFVTAVQEAEREGYGAVVGPSAGDPGLLAARGKVSIPFVGMGWANYTRARQVGGKFSYLHNHLPEIIPIMAMQAGAYGFSENLVSIEHLDIDVYQWLANEEKPNFDELIDIALPLVKHAVERGARAMMIGCGSPELSEFAPILSEITMKEYKIPVLTPIDTVIDVARELMKERL